MSGYLLRMAASVLNPGGSIHPMPGSLHSLSPLPTGEGEFPGQDAGHRSEPRISVFAGRPDLAAPQPEQVTPGPLAPMDRNEPARPAIPPAPSNVSADGNGTVSEQPSEQPDAQPAQVERSSFQPLISLTAQREEAETRASAPPPAVSEADESTRLAPSAATYLSAAFSTPTWAPVDPGRRTNAEQASESPALLETAERETEPKSVREVVYRDRYQPLLAEMTPRTEERAAKPFTAGDRKATRRDFSRREATPERQPDEIRIHIGRVEVVAVPTAPVRAETRPSNKSPNLSDYLKLRHGRL